MQAQQLQNLMVINKSQQLPWKLKTKTLFIDLMTWFLWLYIAYFIYDNVDNILNLPIIANYLILEVLSVMLAIVSGLLFGTVSWAVIARSRKVDV